MTDTPEVWVLIEAAKRCGWTGDIFLFQNYYENDRPYRALCDMIAKHEQSPVDCKLLCADQAKHEFGWDKGWLGTSACVRAIELWESGYGRD